MDDQKQQEIEQVIRAGRGELVSATNLGRPNCHLCGKQQNRWYIDLRYTGVGRYVVCIACANERYEGEDGPKWIDPDAPGERSTAIHIAPVRFVPSLDEFPHLGD